MFISLKRKFELNVLDGCRPCNADDQGFGEEKSRIFSINVMINEDQGDRL